jgi:hypothetical protein
LFPHARGIDNVPDPNSLHWRPGHTDPRGVLNITAAFPENQEKRRAFELNKNEFLTMPLPVQLMPEGMSCHFSYFLR